MSIADFDQDRDVPELLSAKIAMATRIRAAPALQIFIEERRAALRSCAARCSYLFIGANCVIYPSLHHSPVLVAASEFKPISPNRNAIVMVLPLRCDLGLRIPFDAKNSAI
jgi:hypothetical protein